MFDLKIELANSVTRVAVKLDICKSVGSLLQRVATHSNGARVLVVTDDNVGPLYGQTVLDSLASADFAPSEYRIHAGRESSR